jgi:SPX domain protein involved in polyphosphate accumulation
MHFDHRLLRQLWGQCFSWCWWLARAAAATAKPQLAQQDWRQLESQAQAMGQQLLALEQFIHLNQTGFVKIVKKT